MATKREVEFWKHQCRELGAALNRSSDERRELIARSVNDVKKAATAQAVADGLEWQVNELQAENAKLRELVRALVNATHPVDRAKLIENAAELLGEVS